MTEDAQPRFKALDAATKAKHEAGKNLTPWDQTPKSTKKKWLALADGVIAAAKGDRP